MTLHNELGKLIKASELARFLDLDVRTVKKHAKMLGGIELMPGRYYFHLDKIREIMEVASAKFSTKKREGVLQRQDGYARQRSCFCINCERSKHLFFWQEIQ